MDNAEDYRFVSHRHPSSFRDPCGFVYEGSDGTIYRQVNHSYEEEYKRLLNSGLYDKLVSDGLLIPHREVDPSLAFDDHACCVIKPERIPFISYSYEWCFTALKQAALLTISVQRRALEHGMTLKDASAFNVQFNGVKPVFIDTLSFDRYEPGKPWVAYGQFCRHFLAPLALMSYVNIECNRLLLLHLDGIPLELASRLLPVRCSFVPGIMFHLRLHARMVKTHSDTAQRQRSSPSREKMRSVSLEGTYAILASLESTIVKLKLSGQKTEWADYYQNNSYTQNSSSEKLRLVAEYLTATNAKTVWDLGANTAVFSRLATEIGAYTCAFDIDPLCVERAFREQMARGEQGLLPLRLDLTNPTPAIGWAHSERSSLMARGPADVIMALAIMHHLCIANNVPIVELVRFFSVLGRYLIIEFVPKTDPQVNRLLRSRKDIFNNYSIDTFEAEFGQAYRILRRDAVGQDGRVMYFMERKL